MLDGYELDGYDYQCLEGYMNYVTAALERLKEEHGYTEETALKVLELSVQIMQNKTLDAGLPNYDEEISYVSDSLDQIGKNMDKIAKAIALDEYDEDEDTY